MKMLIVDDIPEIAVAIEAYLRESNGLLGEVVEVTLATSVEALEDVLDLGFEYDVTLVDLGLGDEASGLNAVQVLHQSGHGGRVIVHSDLATGDDRLLVLYAVFHWYDDQPGSPFPSALLPKQYSSHGNTLAERSRSFARSIEEIMRDGRPSIDRAAAFRRPTRADSDPFLRLFAKREDFHNLSLMQTYPSFGKAALASGGRVKEQPLRNWGTRKVLDVAELLDDAASHQKETGLTVKPYDTDVDGKSNWPSARLHAFAKSQALFLNDPVAIRQFR